MTSVTANNDIEKQVREETVITNKSPELVNQQFREAPVVDGKRMSIALVHEHGSMDHPPCGGVAFFYTHQPRAGDVLDHDCARLVNGVKPYPASAVTCGTCKSPLLLKNLQLYINKGNEKKRAERNRQRAARKRNRNAR